MIAWDVNFNREVLADTGQFFGTPEQLAPLLEAAERDPVNGRERGIKAQHRAADAYRWDGVADGYEQLCRDLQGGVRRRALRRPGRGSPRD